MFRTLSRFSPGYEGMEDTSFIKLLFSNLTKIKMINEAHIYYSIVLFLS